MRLALLALLTGCLQSNAVRCGANMICPDDQVCVHVSDPDAELCADPSQLTACANQPEYTKCGPDARCYDGVCLPVACGNGRIDRADPNDPSDSGEVCDDGNEASGDGCSSDCHSNETCGNGVIDPIHSETCDDANLLSADGCASTCTPEHARMQTVGSFPMDRTGEAIAYDTVRDRIVMFGGEITFDGLVSDETWEAIASGWVRSVDPPLSPSARSGAAMAYDIAHHQVVLFGGSDGETWTYDGTTWSQLLLLDAPSARKGAAMVYDVKRRVVVMYGGSTFDMVPQLSNETWELDGTHWLKVTAPPPMARSGMAMAYDPTRAVTVMWGGANDPAVYELDGTGWHSYTPTGPGPDPRRGAALAFEPVRGDLILVGGTDVATGTDVQDVWRLHAGQWLPVAALDPPAKPGHVITTDLLRSQVIVIGTSDGADTRAGHASLWSFDGAAWTWASQIELQDRDHYALALDPISNKIVASSAKGIAQFDGSRWSEPELGPGLGATQIAYDPIHRNTVVFGGTAAGVAVDSTWLWDGIWTATAPVTRPPARVGHAMAFDGAGVIVFGGAPCDSCPPTNDTWEWDGTDWHALAPVHQPPARSSPAFAYDPVHQTVVMFGGDGGNSTALGDTWVWNGSDWLAPAPAKSPSPRIGTAMAWDANRRRIVLYGGGGFLSDVWEWDGVSWTQVPVLDAQTRAFHSMTTNLGPGVFSFGGLSKAMTFDSNASVLRWDGGAPIEACRSSVDGDGDGAAGCADPDCWWACAPLCPPGTTCDPNAPHCGDGVCDRVEDGRICPQDCEVIAVCGDGLCDPGETCVADCP